MLMKSLTRVLPLTLAIAALAGAASGDVLIQSVIADKTQLCPYETVSVFVTPVGAVVDPVITVGGTVGNPGILSWTSPGHYEVPVLVESQDQTSSESRMVGID